MFLVILREIFFSKIPAARYSVAMDLLLVVEDSDVIELLDTTNWLSECDSVWMSGLKEIAKKFGVGDEFDYILLSAERNGNRVSKRVEASSDYAEFVKDNYRLS